MFSPYVPLGKVEWVFEENLLRWFPPYVLPGKVKKIPPHRARLRDINLLGGCAMEPLQCLYYLPLLRGAGTGKHCSGFHDATLVLRCGPLCGVCTICPS